MALLLPVRRPAPATGIARGAPLTVATLLALAVTTTTLLGVRGRGAHLLAVGASTNLHNLESHPLDVLFVSAFWVEAAWLFWPVAALVVGVLGLSERRIGSWRTLGVFAAGHVGATLVTVAGVAVGVAHGWLPRELTYAVDVGPSYGLAAVAAVLTVRTPSRRLRLARACALLAALAAAAAVGRDFTDAGHLVAAVIGLVLAPVLRGGSGTTGREALAPASAAVGGVPAIRPADESVPVPLARGFEQHRDVDTYNAVAAPSVTGRRHSRMACSQRLLTPMTGPAQRTCAPFEDMTGAHAGPTVRGGCRCRSTR